MRECWYTLGVVGIPGHLTGPRKHPPVQAPRQFLSSANSKLAGIRADQVTFGNVEVVGNQGQVWGRLVFRNLPVDFEDHNSHRTSLAVSESHWEFPLRAMQEFAMPSEDWMTVSIRKASKLQDSGSEEAPGRVQRAMGMNIRTNWGMHFVPINSYLCNSRSTSIAMYIFNPNQHLYHVYIVCISFYQTPCSQCIDLQLILFERSFYAPLYMTGPKCGYGPKLGTNLINLRVPG